MDYDTFCALQPALGFLPFTTRAVAIATRIHAAPALREARCVGCGCTDGRACPQGCAWLACDRSRGTGVCSCCASHLAGWYAGSATPCGVGGGAVLPAPEDLLEGES